MTSPNQTAIVEDHVDDALANGAKALTGGKRVEGPGDYFEPTVLVDVDHSMKVMRDETFGPVVGVMKVRDSEEALRLANDTRYGLSGSVFGEKERAERVARRVECGAVNVNDVLVNLPRHGRADGRLEGVRDRLPPRRVRDQEVLPRPSRSWSPASAASASRSGSRTPRPAAAWSTGSRRRSMRGTSSGGWGCAAGLEGVCGRESYPSTKSSLARRRSRTPERVLELTLKRVSTPSGPSPTVRVAREGVQEPAMRRMSAESCADPAICLVARHRRAPYTMTRRASSPFRARDSSIAPSGAVSRPPLRARPPSLRHQTPTLSSTPVASLSSWPTATT